MIFRISTPKLVQISIETLSTKNCVGQCNVKVQIIQNCWENTVIILRASSAEITLLACATEAEVFEEVQRDIQGLRALPKEHLKSACDWLDVNYEICTGEVLSIEAIVKIVNPPTQCASEFKNKNHETENPLQTKPYLQFLL